MNSYEYVTMHGAKTILKRRNYMIGTQNVIIRWGKLKKRDSFEHRGVYGRIILKMNVKAVWRRSWIRCIWVRIKTSERLLCSR